MLLFVYKRSKADMDVLKITVEEECDYFDNLYNTIKKELITQAKYYV